MREFEGEQRRFLGEKAILLLPCLRTTNRVHLLPKSIRTLFACKGPGPLNCISRETLPNIDVAAAAASRSIHSTSSWARAAHFRFFLARRHIFKIPQFVQCVKQSPNFTKSAICWKEPDYDFSNEFRATNWFLRSKEHNTLSSCT